MAITYLDGVSAFSESNPVVTGALNTTGADAIVVLVSSLIGDPVITDSKSNTWGSPDLVCPDVDSVAQLSFWVCIPTTVGTGHTFTATDSDGIMSISVLAFSGVLQIAPLEDTVSNNNADSSTSLSTGSITPVGDGRLFVAGLMHYEDGVSSMTINTGFTLRHAIYSDSSDGSQHLGVFSATLIQTTGGAVNPTWSWSGLSLGSAGMLTLLPAETGTPGDIRAWASGWGIGIGQQGGMTAVNIGDIRVWALGHGIGIGQLGGATVDDERLFQWRAAYNIWHRSAS